jgi:hypothetical protein
MRQDNAVSTTRVATLFDQPEFQPFKNLYGFYEVRGMKMEATVAPTARIVGSGLFAGAAPGLTGAPIFPILNDIVKLPIQTKGNTQGEMYQAYYAYSSDLKRQGAQFSIPTTDVYPVGNCGVMVSRYEIAAP